MIAKLTNITRFTMVSGFISGIDLTNRPHLVCVEIIYTKLYMFHHVSQLQSVYWLVVEPPLWKIWLRQLGLLFPIYGKIKNVPNHQAVYIIIYPSIAGFSFISLAPIHLSFPTQTLAKPDPWSWQLLQRPNRFSGILYLFNLLEGYPLVI